MSIKDNFKPVRKPKPVYGSVSGYYAFRGEDTIWFESTLERDLLQKLEFNANVMQVVSQPVEIPYRTNLGNLSTYTPDFLVQFYETKCHQPPLLIEVKPIQKLKKDWTILKPKLKAGFEYAYDHGWNFKIYDEKRIRDQLLANIQFLKRYKNADFPKDDTIRILDKLEEFGFNCVNGLARKIISVIQNKSAIDLALYFKEFGYTKQSFTSRVMINRYNFNTDFLEYLPSLPRKRKDVIKKKFTHAIEPLPKEQVLKKWNQLLMKLK